MKIYGMVWIPNADGIRVDNASIHKEGEETKDAVDRRTDVDGLRMCVLYSSG